MSELTKTYAGWHPDLLRLYTYSTRWYKWALYDRDPVEVQAPGVASQIAVNDNAFDPASCFLRFLPPSMQQPQ